jgi:rhamnogalacturonyl hydrolase YesR
MLTRIPAQVDRFTGSLPEGKRLPFNWPVAEAPTVLRFEPANAAGDILELRLTNAWDVRQPLKVAVTLATSGERVGVIDASYAPPFVPQSCVIERRLLPRVIQEGLALAVIEGDEPFRFHIESTETPASLAAQLLIHNGAGTVESALDRLASLGSIQMFGWEEGCVIEALDDLAGCTGDTVRYLGAIDQHLARFFTGEGGVQWEFSRNTVHDGRVEAIESTIMYAALSRGHKNHPLLPAVEAFWKTREDAEGCVVDTMTSCEGAYTVAYPMAAFALAATWRDDSAAVEGFTENALRQLRLRRERLSTSDGIFLRRYPDGRTTHYNWSRGIAWYLLGFVHTARTLWTVHRRYDPDILAEINRVARWALSLRDKSGLWHCFAGEPETGLETSGTAGICAAIAVACTGDMIDRSFRDELKPSWAVLQQWLTPDGLLRGIAPSNRAGEPYQRTGVRVMSPFGLGLWGQFAARML